MAVKQLRRDEQNPTDAQHFEAFLVLQRKIQKAHQGPQVSATAQPRTQGVPQAPGLILEGSGQSPGQEGAAVEEPPTKCLPRLVVSG